MIVAVSTRNTFSWLKLHYDKLIAVIVLVLLVGSLVYLAVKIGTMHKEKQKFEDEIRGYKPRHEKAAPVDTKTYDEAFSRIEKPVQLTNEQWTNSWVFMPEKRVWCVDCRRPIAYDAMKCPFCLTEQPPPREIDPKWDSDNDGIPDMQEKKYNMNPQDAADAEQDMDNDGFTNIEEIRAGTDPTKAADSPSITSKLRLMRIDPDPFMLRFKSVVKLPDGSLQFGLNLRRNERTYFAKVGAEVLGFKLETFEPKIVEKVVPGIGKMKVDASILTLKRGDKMIPLIKDEEVQWNEFTAHMMFTLDNSKYSVKMDNVIELKNKKFKILSIDSKNDSVLIESVIDGQRSTIGKFPESRKETPVTQEPEKSGGTTKPVVKTGEEL
jgi:hypothetical protein